MKRDYVAYIDHENKCFVTDLPIVTKSGEEVTKEDIGYRFLLLTGDRWIMGRQCFTYEEARSRIINDIKRPHVNNIWDDIIIIPPGYKFKGG